jgi:MFS family permease
MNTTDTTCTQAEVDALLGRKIVNRVMLITSQTIAGTLAFCCSSFWLGLLTYIVVGLLLAALALVAMAYMGMFVTDEKFESLGHHVGSALGTVRGWFSRKEEIAAA